MKGAQSLNSYIMAEVLSPPGIRLVRDSFKRIQWFRKGDDGVAEMFRLAGWIIRNVGMGLCLCMDH